MLSERRLDAGGEVAAISFVIGMLQLATPALGKVTARRLLVMRTEGQCAVIEHGVPGNAEGHVAAA